MKQIKLTRVLSLSIILMFILTANGFAEQQPGQIYEYGTHFYQVVTTEYQELTWKEAKAAAQDLPAYIDNGVAHYPHLATITSQDEQDFLYSKVHSITTNWLWIGLYQIEGSYDPKEGWTWVTGEDFVYSNWNPGEPNNIDGDESYCEWSGSDVWLGGWNDNVLEGRAYGYIVEYEASLNCPAAPAVAAAILKEQGIHPKYVIEILAVNPEDEQVVNGNYISDVAEYMGSQPNDEGKTWFEGINKCDVYDYHDAVYEYLESLGAFGSE